MKNDFLFRIVTKPVHFLGINTTKGSKACIKKWQMLLKGNKIDLNKWRQTIFIDEEIPNIFINVQ